MYTYYIKVESEEHMLFIIEIAEQFNIYSESNKPHIKLVSEAIRHILNKEKSLKASIYYQTKTSLRQVYPKAIYLKAIKYIQDNSTIIDDINRQIIIGKTTFKYKNGRHN